MNWIRIIIEYLTCFAEVALISYFYSAFKKPRLNFKTLVSVLVGVSFVYGTVVSFAPTKNTLFLFSIIITLIVALCYKFKWYIALFMSLLFSVISALSEFLVMQGVTLLGENNFDTLNESLYAYLSGVLSTKMLTYLIILVIRKQRHKSFQSIKGMHFIGLLMLPCATVAIIMVCSYTLFKYEVNSFSKYLSIFAFVFLIVSNIMIFFISDNQYELISAKEKLKTSEVLLTNQKQYYEDIFKSQQEIRKTRHDLKNVFIALLGELNAGNIETSREIIQKKLNDLEQRVDIATDVDNMIDAIIYSKVLEAKKAGVSLVVKKNIDRPILINNLDLAVLLANILDNAIEATVAVESDKVITLSLMTDSDNVIILSQNPTINSYVDGKIKTTKKDKKHHGFGTLSINSIAEKYNGSFIIEFENGIAIATVILTNFSE